jgi:hydroxyacylglutathione hydrolase
MDENDLLPAHAFTAHRLPVDDLTLVAITDEGLGNTSWVARVRDTAIVVDPERDPLPYQTVAARLGVEIAFSADTHLHADFITGTPELAAGGARAVASRAGGSSWPHQGVSPGDVIDIGIDRWAIEVLGTPGHTPEHVAYVMTGDTPRAVFTGGALLVGAVARTDLTDPGDTEALTRALYQSIHRELLALPDDVLVLPTHGAGSFCSAAVGARRWTTIGDERRANPLLSAPDEETFVRRVLDQLGSYPPYFLRLRSVNRLGPHVYGTLPSLRPLSAEQVVEQRDRGAHVVDVRPVADYAAGHITGSLANTLRPQFASWLGWVVADPATPLVFVTDEHTDRRELVRQCLNIGYENLVGELTGGMDGWRGAGGDVASVSLVDARQLDGHGVVDVRQRKEFATGHIPGAINIELGAISETPPALPDGPLVLMCGHGERAASAASLLEADGRTGLVVATGGPGDWAEGTGQQLAP